MAIDAGLRIFRIELNLPLNPASGESSQQTASSRRAYRLPPNDDHPFASCRSMTEPGPNRLRTNSDSKFIGRVAAKWLETRPPTALSKLFLFPAYYFQFFARTLRVKGGRGSAYFLCNQPDARFKAGLPAVSASLAASS